MSDIRYASIDSRGYLNSLYKQGFNNEKCQLELLANANDAGATVFISRITRDYIFIEDNGKGMNESEVKSKYLLWQNENHTNDKSLGISGMGGKVATLFLSKKKDVTVYTYDGETYTKISIPWEQIFEKSDLSMMQMSSMTEDDKKEIKFTSSGTIIKLPYIAK